MATSSLIYSLAKLSYHVSPAGGEQAFQNTFPDPITGEYKRNFTKEEKEIVVENVRGKEDTVSLDTTGFQFYKHASKLTSFANEDEIRNIYYPECTEFIKNLTGASRVVLFDHTIRSPTIKGPDAQVSQPVNVVHGDQSNAASIGRVHKHLPAADVPKLLEGRFQIINLWRPINVPALDWPLALCDYRSVDLEKDITLLKVVFKDRVGETLGIKYNKDHKWSYIYGMTPEDFVLLKCFDSVQDGSVAVFTPHTSFPDSNAPEGAAPRESIEVRCLVFYD